MSVSLTADQVSFSQQLAARTGYSPQVIEAFVASEGNPRGYTGNYNFLNTTVTSGGVTVPGNYRHFSSYPSISAAVDDGAAFFNRLGLTQGGAGKPPAAQLSAIANSPWGGASLGTLTQLYNQVTGGTTIVPSAGAALSDPGAVAAASSSDTLFTLPVLGAFKASWGRALAGGAILVAGGVVMIIGLYMIAGRDLPSLPSVGGRAVSRNDQLEKEYDASQRELEAEARAESRERTRSKVANRERLASAA